MPARVTCPCCNGAKRMRVHEYDRDDDGQLIEIVRLDICCHCEGEGEVSVEAEGDYAAPNDTQVETPASLKRAQLSRAAKRDHLLGLRTSPDDIEKILATLYPTESA